MQFILLILPLENMWSKENIVLYNICIKKFMYVVHVYICLSMDTYTLP